MDATERLQWAEECSGVCARCHEHTGFSIDEFGEVVSDCCAAAPWDPSTYADAGEL